jgi:hypothetical protein
VNLLDVRADVIGDQLVLVDLRIHRDVCSTAGAQNRLFSTFHPPLGTPLKRDV